MNLVKTSLLNGVAVAIKMASALALNKILAIYVGPAGYAVIGQFQNVVSVLVNLSGGLLTAGVTKATAQHFDNEQGQKDVWETAVRSSLLTSCLTSLILLIFNKEVAELVLSRSDMPKLFIWLAVAIPAIAANNLLLAIMNGKKEVAEYITLNIIGSLVTATLIGILAYIYGLYGALLAFTISPGFVLISTLLFIWRKKWFKSVLSIGRFHKPAVKELSGFAMMGLTSALLTPLSYVAIRNHISYRLGIESAGYWQASWKISEIYLMLVTSTLAVYYLPRLAEIRTSSELRTEISGVYRFLMPIVILVAILMYFLRDLIINILFSANFLPMRELFGWQLLGDVMKIGSWILAYIMIGRSMVKVFVISEVLFSISFVCSSWLLVDYVGLIGVAMAYAGNYFCYWVGMIYLTKMELKKMDFAASDVSD